MASMKLRVRAATGGPTVRVQVPLLCSLQGLKDTLAPLISLSPLSFSLSLNKKDAIDGPGAALLSSFGVTSGDLLFYLVESGGGSVPVPAATSSQQSGVIAQALRPSRETLGSGGVSGSSSGTGTSTSSPVSTNRAVDKSSLRELCASAATRRATLAQPMPIPVEQPTENRECSHAGTPSDRSVTSLPVDSAQNVQSSTGNIDLEAVTGGAGFYSFSGRRLPVPDLLQRVLCSEKGNVRQASSYLVLAVHAVMLETGFVRVDPASEGHELPAGWSCGGHVNLVYSLPELIISNNSESGRAQGEEALLRCQIVGNAVVVYGAVTGGTVHRLSLSVKKFLLEDAVLRTNGHECSKEKDTVVEDMNEEPVERTQSEIADSSEAPRAVGLEKEKPVFRNIFELWKDVKDSLSLPLLSVICEKAGLPPPPSLLRLPTELKIKVLESLPAVALASLACVSSELRFLTANEEVWKQQYRKEFGAGGERAPGGRGWKNAFVRDWEHRRRREEERREAERYFRNDVFPPGTILRAPPYAPDFGGMDYFARMEGGSRGGFGGFGSDGGAGFRNYGFRGGMRGNSATGFTGTQAVGGHDFISGDNRDEVGGFVGMDPYMDGVVYSGQGLRPWPSPNSLPSRGQRSLGTYGDARVLDFQSRNRLDGEGDTGVFLDFGLYHR